MNHLNDNTKQHIGVNFPTWSSVCMATHASSSGCPVIKQLSTSHQDKSGDIQLALAIHMPCGQYI